MAEQSYLLHDFRRKEKISKKLSFALSKGSADLGLHMDHEGWIYLDLLPKRVWN